MSQLYTIKTLSSKNDGSILKPLYDQIFLPEEVGEFAEILFHHFPFTKPEYWYIAEEKETYQPAGGLTLIPWSLLLQDIEIKTAEMGIVGTVKEHRNRGLIKKLSAFFDEVCKNENYDLQIIQGIPGFYHRLGYHYAISLDNHINIPLYAIEEKGDENRYNIRPCEARDIPFLMAEEKKYNERYFITCRRTKEHWDYILSHSKDTECASDIYIFESADLSELYYVKINLMGFGTGLIVSEISEDISDQALKFLMAFLKEEAIKRKKPYVRLNLSTAAITSQRAFAMGAALGRSYGFQVKITDRYRFIKKIKPVLEQRMSESRFHSFKGVFTLNLYTHQYNFNINNSIVTDITDEKIESAFSVSIPEDLLAPLVLGFRSWKELQLNRPDLFIEDSSAGEFLDILFPKQDSWINCQY